MIRYDFQFCTYNLQAKGLSTSEDLSFYLHLFNVKRISPICNPPFKQAALNRPSNCSRTDYLSMHSRVLVDVDKDDLAAFHTGKALYQNISTSQTSKARELTSKIAFLKCGLKGVFVAQGINDTSDPYYT
uniref:Endo/exonuclease/phosphatase domain-containing protein n=1 Tax=Steinernema glaseri TaxID=37863 RepID=A0A1I7ZND3_9BILA